MKMNKKDSIKRKIDDKKSATSVKKKKPKNEKIVEIDNSGKSDFSETPAIMSQEQSQCHEHKRRKKRKKHEIDETPENLANEKIPKNCNESDIANGEIANGDQASSEQNIQDAEDDEETEKCKISDKEANKLSGKSLRKSFNSREGLDALGKFLTVCKENKQRDLAAEYLQAGGSVLEILRLLDTSDKKNTNNTSMVFSAMHVVMMKILSEFPQYQSNAEEACRHFINSHLSFVHSMLSSQSNVKHRKIVLRLLASMVSLGGSLPRELLGHLSFHSQVLETLSQQTKPTDPQSVRTCFIHFVLAFLVEGNTTVIRALLDKRGMLSCIFSELIYDSHTTVHLVLDTVKTYVLENSAISKTQKLHVFSTPVLQSLVTLYNWKGPKNWPGPRAKKRDTSKDIVHPEEKEIAVEAVHDFMTVLLTSSRYGVIFNDRTLGTSGRKHNQLVNTVLQSLDRPWEHPRPLDLVIRVLTACPDLIRSQLTYTEPFLEPRASEKWISAMRFVGKLIASLEPENCLKPCLPELAGSQLISAVQTLAIPQTVLKSSINRALGENSMMIRHEAVILLTGMFEQVTNFTSVVRKNSPSSEFLAFKNSMNDYIMKNAPSLDSLLKVWDLALASMPEEIETFGPQRQQHFSAILDLLQAYQKVLSERSEFPISGDLQPEILLTGIDDLKDVETTELEEMKLKALRFLLLVDIAAFSPTKSLFGKALNFLIGVIDKSTSAKNVQCLETIKILLSNTGIFEGCSDEIELWFWAFSDLETETRVPIANWFVNIVENAIKKSAKYLKLIVEAEESAGERIVSAGRLQPIFDHLSRKNLDKQHAKIVKMTSPTSISPVLCSALDNLKKHPEKSIAHFLSRVSTLALHCQVNPGTLIHLAQGIKDFPAKKYFAGWLPDGKPVGIKKSFPSDSEIIKLSNFLISEENMEIENLFQGEKIVEFEYQEKKIILRHDLEDHDTEILMKMALFYLAQFTQRELMDTQFERCKLSLIALLHVAKSFTDDFVLKCSRALFAHPAILEYFSPICKSKNTTEKTVTNGLIDICRCVVELNETNHVPELFFSLKNKLVSQLCEAARKCTNSEKMKNSSFLIDYIKILRPTTKDVIDILKEIVQLPKDHFIIDKTSESVWGNLVPMLVQLLAERKNDCSSDETMDVNLVKKIVSYTIQLKGLRKICMNAWENSLRLYLEAFPHNLAGIDGHAFNSLLKLPKSSTTISLLSLITSRNDQFIPLFVKFVSNHPITLAQSDLIFSIIASNLAHSWNKEFLKKLHSHYKKDAMQYFSEPTNTKNWMSKNVPAAIFFIETCFESEDCQEACKTILSNGDKLDNVEIGSVKILESLFKRSSKLEESPEDALTKLVQVIMRIMVSTLKKDSKNEEKLDALCRSICETIKLLKSKNNAFVFEELNKNYSWPQFTRFSLKLGLKLSKKDKKSVSLLKTLVSVCDIAYNDTGNEEYVKTLFEMTTSHSEFVNIMLSSDEIKRYLLELLWVLIRKNHLTMSSTHVPLYLAAYNATLAESDQFILMILQHYESNGIKLGEYKPYLWGEAAATHYSVKGEADTALWRQPSTSQVLDLFNSETIKETIRLFPVHRDLKPSELCEAQKVYDPAFYLPLLSYLLADNNVVACHKVTHSGVLALVFAASGSSCAEIRLGAFTAISRFYFHLEATSSKEKHLWVRFIDALRNGISNVNSTLREFRPSCLVSTFLARASLVTSQPMNVLYLPLQAFLMAKPALELNAIPELLQLFHSSDIEHKAHRHWILEVIRDGMKTSLDMDIAVKCLLYKMLSDFYTSVLADPVTKRLILQIIESTVKISKAGLLLARSYGLFVWLNELSSNLTERDVEIVNLVISIISKSLKAIMTTNDRDRDLQFLSLNVLKTLKGCLSKNIGAAYYHFYTSALTELMRTKSYREALTRQDVKEIIDLGAAIVGEVGSTVDTFRHGGKYCPKVENSISTMDDETTIGRTSLRKLVLTWCGHGPTES